VIQLPEVSTTLLEFSPRGSGGNGGLNHQFGPRKRGAVASESAVCLGHGTKMLELGSNAADAVSIPFDGANYDIVRMLTEDLVGCH
jgi:gamma-glutamyltranspeptidase/glutathione hydrolase